MMQITRRRLFGLFGGVSLAAIGIAIGERQSKNKRYKTDAELFDYGAPQLKHWDSKFFAEYMNQNPFMKRQLNG